MRCWTSTFGRWSDPADDVRDLELEIVDDGGELVGRASVGAQKRGAGARKPQRAVVVALGAAALERACGCRRVDLTALALSNRPFVELDVEPGEIAEDRLLATRDRSCRIRVVDPQQQRTSVRVREATVRDGRERVAEVQRAGRARGEADADGHGYASIGTCPGWATTRSSHARMAGYGSRSKSPSCATCVYAKSEMSAIE